MRVSNHQYIDIVILSTNTNEKTEQYNTIARELSLPLFFIQMDRFKNLRDAKEDTGSMDGNIDQKFAAAKENESSIHKDPAFIEYMLLFCEKNHIPVEKVRIHVGPEDSSINLSDKKTWDILKVLLQETVEDEIIQRAEANKSNIGLGPELAPIATTVGWDRFFDLWNKASLLAGQDSAYLTDEAELSVKPLGGLKGSKPTTIKERVKLCLTKRTKQTPAYLPNGVMQQHNTYLFLSEEDTQDIPNETKRRHFLVKKSVRSKIVQSLHAKLSKLNNGAYKPLQQAPAILKKARKPFCVNHVHEITWDQAAHVEASITEKTFNLLTPNPLFEHHDYLILHAPSHYATDKEKRFVRYKLYNAPITASLEAAHAHKRTLILNDGSYTDDINNIIYLANKGFWGDHVRPAFAESIRYDSIEGVHHLCLGHMDVLTTESPKLMKKAADALVKVREHDFIPYTFPYNKDLICEDRGDKPPVHAPVIAMFTSATNGNKNALGLNADIGRHSAETYWHLITGGGDSIGKCMWASVHGYNQGRINGFSHAQGVSTETIVHRESEEGCINPHLYNQSVMFDGDFARTMREATMFAKSDHMLMLPGGNGTLGGEALGSMLMNFYLETNKPIHFVSKDINGSGHHYWEPVLRNLLGNDVAEKIEKDHTAFANSKCPVILSTSKEEAIAHIDDARHNWYAQNAKTKAPDLRVA